tara:strand:+ start:112 stop:417 length:306 start_codon:yes stop_codon:yes gene_type:complete
MTFEQFQATRKKHTNTTDSMWEHTDSDSTAKQAYIYLANDNSYDPTKHHSNYFHIEITPNGYEAIYSFGKNLELDRTLWETTDLEAIERAMFDMLVEWGEI